MNKVQVETLVVDEKATEDTKNTEVSDNSQQSLIVTQDAALDENKVTNQEVSSADVLDIEQVDEEDIQSSVEALDKELEQLHKELDEQVKLRSEDAALEDSNQDSAFNTSSAQLKQSTFDNSNASKDSNVQENSSSLIDESIIKARRHKDPFVAPANIDIEKKVKSASSTVDNTLQVKALQQQDNKTLVLYFSQPEVIDSDNIDALTGASIILSDNVHYGIVEFLAKEIASQLKIKAVRILSVNPYPHTHEDLVDRVSHEQDVKARPEINFSPEVNLSEYDTIFVGFPIWWSELPMPIYTLFEDNDFSGKTIIPFCAYSREKPTEILRGITKLEPNAKVLTNFLMIERSRVQQKARNIVNKYLYKIGLLKKEIVQTKAAEAIQNSKKSSS